MERFTGWTGYYTYDPRGSVSGVTDADGGLWASYRYNATRKMTFGEPEYNQIYGYNAESYNPMLELQYLRARYYDVERGNFLTEDTYLGDISDPLTLNRYNYVKSNPLNYIEPSGHDFQSPEDMPMRGGNGWHDAIQAIGDLFDEHGGAMAGAATGVAIVALLLPGAGAVILVGSALIAGGAGYIVGGVTDSEFKKADIRKALKEEGIKIDSENIAIEHLRTQMEEGKNLTEEEINLCEEYNYLTEKEWRYIYQGQATMAAGEIILESPAILAALKGILDSGKQIGSNLRTTINRWLSKGGSRTLKNGIYTNLEDGLNFSNKALEHMKESGRQVPVQVLQDAIRNGQAMPDPRGSNATMYYTTMNKNGKMYNLEVLYDETTNTVYHFEYARRAMGNLPAISK